ncbi:hypothetical protein QXB69_000521 [Vibrio fluvialis]|nr:hypothetical protein [Vibrio fluvialis]
MSIYSISYDLNAPGKKYEELYDAIKSFNGWAHILDSTWLVYSNLTAQQIFEHLQPHIDRNDSIFISQVNRNQYSGWLSKEHWSWINKHF